MGAFTLGACFGLPLSEMGTLNDSMPPLYYRGSPGKLAPTLGCRSLSPDWARGR